LNASQTAARGVKLGARLLSGGRFLPGASLFANASRRLRPHELAPVPPEGQGLFEQTVPAIGRES
jgi:hypothetical protein